MQTSVGKSKKYRLVILSKEATTSLTLFLIIAVVGTPQGPKLTRKTSGRSIGTQHFVEIVTVFFISFKLPVMNC